MGAAYCRQIYILYFWRGQGFPRSDHSGALEQQQGNLWANREGKGSSPAAGIRHRASSDCHTGTLHAPVLLLLLLLLLVLQETAGAASGGQSGLLGRANRAIGSRCCREACVVRGWRARGSSARTPPPRESRCPSSLTMLPAPSRPRACFTCSFACAGRQRKSPSSPAMASDRRSWTRPSRCSMLVRNASRRSRAAARRRRRTPAAKPRPHAALGRSLERERPELRVRERAGRWRGVGRPRLPPTGGDH